MIRKGDIQWWVLETKKHPESAPAIIEELAKRLIELDAENEQLRDEIIEMHQPAPVSADSEELDSLRRKIATLQSLLDGTTSAEPSVALLSDWLQSVRMPLSQAQRLAREERSIIDKQTPPGLRHLLLVHLQGELVLFTNQGRGLKMQPTDVPPLVEGEDWPAAQEQRLAKDERLAAATVITEIPRFWTVVTKRGFARQFLRIELDQRISKGDRLIESPFRNDEPVAMVNGDQGDLLLLTRWGKGIRFSHRAIASEGSIALELEPDDEIAAAVSLPTDIEILIVTASGFAARRDTSQFTSRSRPGGTGKTLIQAFDVLNALPNDPQAQLLYLTYSSKLVALPTADVPLHHRSSKGSRVHVFDRDPAVAVILIPGKG
jgi:DNA gyrase subunit A